MNVFTPGLAGALPVLVWIHGGGFIGGCNAAPWYVGTSFNRDGVVVVSVNYRLGAEGFLLLPGAPANRAVLDWVAALQWVQDNIRAFGGDPRRVTIAGQSAGGMACATLLGVPAARDTFRAAVCLSGSAGHTRTAEDARTIGAELADQLGIEFSRDAFEQVDSGELVAGQERLMNPWPADDTAAGLAARLGRIELPFSPVLDGEIVTQTSLEAAHDETARTVPLLVGVMANEFVMAMRDAKWITADLLTEALLMLGCDPSDVPRYLDLHSGQTPAEIAGQVMTDRTFRLPMHELLAAAPAGYGYEFRWTPADGQFAGLAMHCLDVPFVFDLLSAPGVPEAAGSTPPQSLADSLHRAVTSFITGLSPGWAAYAQGNRATMIFGEITGVEDDPLAFERALWATAQRSAA